MPLKTEDFWVERILSLKGQNERWGAGRIHGELKKEALKDGWSFDVSPRTVSRILDREWKPKTEAEKAQYRLVHWPESMGTPDLPWGTSAATLELLAFLDVIGVRQRPPVRFAKWFWRTRCAAPRARKDLRVVAAADLARKEALGAPVERGIEWWLAYMQIEDDEQRRKLYEEARNRSPEDDPIPNFPNQLQASTKDAADLGFWMELLYALGFGIKAQRTQEQRP